MSVQGEEADTDDRLPPGRLTDEERRQYELLIDRRPDLESAEIARRVLNYYDEEES